MNGPIIDPDTDSKPLNQVELFAQVWDGVAEICPLGLIVTDPCGHILLANDNAVRLLDLVPVRNSELEAWRFPAWPLQSSEDEPLHQGVVPYRQVHQTNRPVKDFRLSLARPGRDPVELSINTGPLQGPDGKWSGMVSVIEDITEKIIENRSIINREANLRTIFNAVQDLVFIKNRDFQYTFLNTAAISFFQNLGLDPLGKTDREIWEWDRAQVIRETDELVCSGQIVESSQLFETGAAPQTHKVIKVPLPGKDGRIEGICGIARNATPAVVLSQALRDQKRLYKAIFENSWGITILLKVEEDGATRILTINPAVVKKTGLPISEWIGKNPRDLLDPESAATFDRHIAHCIQFGRKISINEEIELAGTIFSVAATLIPLENDQGEIDRILVVTADLTGIQGSLSWVLEKEKELARQSRKLAEANYALKTVIDLKEKELADQETNMLATLQTLIMPFLEKLRITGLGQGQSALVDVVISSLEHIAEPLARKLSGPNLKLTPAEIQLAELIRQGRTTKEAAAMLNLSQETVASYRKNIRAKLGLTGQKNNLATFLNALR